MVVLVFVLGRPGSGKSAAARLLTTFLWEEGWSVRHFGDYSILLEWYKNEVDSGEFRKFKPARKDHGQEIVNSDAREKLYTSGFDVVDFSVLDAALYELERKIRQSMYFSNEKEVFIVEFARNNYIDAFSKLSYELLHQAYFLFFYADMPICLERVHDRSNNQSESDNHFVSEEIIRNYYTDDIPGYAGDILKWSVIAQVSEKRILFCDNNGIIQALGEITDEFTHRLIMSFELPIFSSSDYLVDESDLDIISKLRIHYED